MTSSGASSSAANAEFPVIVPKDKEVGGKIFHLLRFSGSADVPNMLKNRKVYMKREDNAKHIAQPGNQPDGKEALPKTGAGSEFGREEREERFRRLRGGAARKKYNPDDQPWVVTFAPPKDVKAEAKQGSSNGRQKKKRFRGLREAGVTENASWFIFAQKPDKSFIALPISEWYGFTAMTQYDHLNSEEVEEEFQKRKKTLNYFSLMLQKRLKQNQDMEPSELAEHIKEEEVMAKKGGRRGLMLTDVDAEWVDEDEDADSDMEDYVKKEEKVKGEIEDDEFDFTGASKGKSKANKKAAQILQKKRRLRSKADGDLSDSDEGDFDGREVDYMTSSGEDSELDDIKLPDDVKEEVEEAETEERGVEDEDGLRKLNDSGEEDEEDEETKDSKDDEIEIEEKEGKSESRQGLSDSDSDSGKDDDSDSDIDNLDSSVSKHASKRRMAAEVITASGKRVKLDLNSTAADTQQSSSSGSSGSSSQKAAGSDIDSQLEQAIKHYLSRTPMTATQLVEKFLQKARAATSTPPTPQELTRRIATIILRLKPDKINSNGNVYFSLAPEKSH